ncbi:MAG: hypothetical protein QXR35_02470 [Candidatus Korarchaeum sp.]
MIGASKEVVLTIIMLLLLASISLILELTSSMIAEGNCKQVKEIAEEIKRLSSSLRIDADSYATRMERDSCGS